MEKLSEKYELEITPEKRLDLLTQLTAGLLASGHFTLPLQTRNGMSIEEGIDFKVPNTFYPKAGNGGGYSGPPLAVQAASDLLISLMLEVEGHENEE